MTSTLDIKSAHAQFLDHLNSRRRAQATIVAYGKDIEQLVTFLATLGKKSVADITNVEIDLYIKKLAGDSYTPKSVSRKLTPSKHFSASSRRQRSYP